MSVASALESLLLQFIGPYVEGIDLSSLQSGILRGQIQLKNIRIKPELLALLGLEGFRLEDSKVCNICLNIPWHSIFTGKISLLVEGIQANVRHSGEARSDEEVLESLRRGRAEALTARVEQLRTIARQRQRAQAYVEDKKRQEPGFLLRAAFKFVNNITISIAGVEASFTSANFGVGLRAGLGELAALSTDAAFARTSDKETIEGEGSDVYKLFRISRLFLQVSSAPDGALGPDAAYVLTPCSAEVRLSHLHEQELVKLAVDLGMDRTNELTVLHSQLARIMSAQAAIVVEQEHAERLLMPRGKAKSILSNMRASKDEYGQLYYRTLTLETLPQEQAERLALLEDALPVNVLASLRWVAEDSYAKVLAAGFWGRLQSFLTCASCGSAAAAEVLEADAVAEWDFSLAESLESLSVPQKLDIKVQSGRLVLSVNDDRYSEEVSCWKLLHVDVLGTDVAVHVDLCEDYLGNPSAATKVSVVVHEISATHAGMDAIRVRSTAAAQSAESTDFLRLHINTTLEEDHNLLSVSVKALPLDITLYPSLLQQILEFVEVFTTEELPPNSPASHLSAASSHSGSPLAAAAAGGDGRLVGDAVGDRAAELVDELAKRAPDRLSLDIDVAAPLIHVPLSGLGKLSLKLGNLKLTTPGACDVNSLQMAICLSDTVLRTMTHVGQVFEVISPTLIGVDLLVHDSEDAVAVRVGAHIKKADFGLSPQALQLIVSAVVALTPPEAVMDAAKSFADRASNDEKLDALLADAQHLTEALKTTAAAKKLEALGEKRLAVDVAATIEALRLVVWDDAVPFLRLTSSLADSVNVRCEGIVAGDVSTVVQVPEIALDLRALNHRNGAWEPVLEDLRLGVGVSVEPGKADGGQPPIVTSVAVIANTPLLLNVVPATVQRVVQLVPVWAACALPVEELVKAERTVLPTITESAAAAGVWTTYRAINLSDQVLDIEITDVPGKRVSLEPTGSAWKSLDGLILSSASTSLTVSVAGGERSAPLHLERCGAVTVPGGSVRAELMTHRDGHRVLLLAPPLQLHNATDLPVYVDFLDGQDHVQTELALSSSVCEGALVGLFKPEHPTRSDFTGAPTPDCEGSLLLPPNAVCAVPARLLLGGTSAVKLRAMPAVLGAEFSKVVKLGSGADAEVLSCVRNFVDVNDRTLSPTSFLRRRKNPVGCVCCGAPPGQPQQPADAASADMLYLRVEVQERLNPLPDPLEALTFTTIVLKPPVTFLNAVPVDKLDVSLAEEPKGLRAAVWSKAPVESMTGFNFYSTAGDDVHLKFRLRRDAPWSKALHVKLDNAKGPARSQAVDIADKDGGAGGALLEVVGRSQVRLSCPAWLVDRAGLSGMGEFSVRSGGKPLPCSGGITVLPTDAFDESVDLSLTFPDGGKLTEHMKLPPNHAKFCWSGPKGSLGICIQTEDIAPAGVLGAACKVLIVRPRLMLTNASDQDLEFCLFGQAPRRNVVRTLLGRRSLSPMRRGKGDKDGKGEKDEPQERGTSSETTSAALKVYERVKQARPSFRSQPKPEPMNEAELCHLAPGRIVTLPAGVTCELHVDPAASGMDAKALATVLSFREVGEGDDAWAGPVICSDNTVGRRAWLTPTAEGGHSVWTAAVAAGRGALDVAFERDSEVVAVNRVRSLPRPVMVVKPIAPGEPRPRGGGASPSKGSSSPVATAVTPSSPGTMSHIQGNIRVLGRQQTPIGWPKQTNDGKSSWQLEVTIDGATYSIPDVRKATSIPVANDEGRNLELCVLRASGKIVVALEERLFQVSGLLQETICNVEVKIPHLGVSLVTEAPTPCELLFLSLDHLHLQFVTNETTDIEQLRLSIADIQLDCQLPGRQESTGAEERAGSEQLRMLAPDRRAVLLCKQEGMESCDFVSVVYQRESISSQDTVFSALEVDLAKIELCFDSGWFEPLLHSIEAIVGDAAQDFGLPVATITETAGRPFSEGYQHLNTPAAFVMEGMRISELDIRCWVSLPFESLDFLPKYVRTALQVMCISRHFTLKNATLALPAKVIPSSCGSAEDFGLGIAMEYGFAIIRNVAGILGKSSLLNLPKAPIVLGAGSAAMVADRVTGMAGEAAVRLTALTLDSKYAEQRRAQHDAKQIDHAGDGLVEAGKSLALGARGLLDIVVKPVEGARDGGVKGFARGIGQGIAGAVVKPIVGVGTAVADLGSGLAASVAAGPALRKKHHRQQRSRLPRLLFGDLGEIRPYSEVHAAFLQAYGSEFCRAVSEILPLALEEDAWALLVLFRSRAAIVEVAAPSEGSRPSRPSGSAAPPGPLAKHFGDVFSAAAEGRARELQFKDLASVSVQDKEERLVLADRSKKEHVIKLLPGALDDAAFAALEQGFAGLLRGAAGVANWRALHALLDDAAWASMLAAGGGAGASRMYRSLEVIEVQRRWKVKEWRTPYLPTDVDLSWRWVDKRGKRHPHLIEGLGREEAAAEAQPPCRLDPKKYQASSEWVAQVHSGTDAEGWTYASNWGSPNWAAEATMLDALRRRVWTRKFA